MVIESSMIIKPGEYFLSSDSLISPAIVINGDNITIDFQGATVIGDTNYYSPESFSGLGIHVTDGSNIIIKNLNIRGFKVGLMAEGVPGIRIEESNFSYNYRPKLKSRREREDLSDWLSYHNNEEDEWLRFGSGIYLKNCDRAMIKNNIISQNQNALLMVSCNSGEVYNNRFSFNSGLGIGLYRSSQNTIMHNCLDFNVRGYSHGFYRRGQDSAGALFYEQSSRNVFAYNSATHSGDGFFLWAGQHTMDTGEGGCNDNLIAYNDFSYAPTNGIEVTFSSNIIIGNKMADCRYGIWGGYSYDTYIAHNEFIDNDYGVAIEHGHNNTIVHNDFEGDKIGIQLWERGSQPADWGFAENRDVSSRDYYLGNNLFSNVDMVYDIRNTERVDSNYQELKEFDIPEKLVDGIVAERVYLQEGRDKMMVNEWGPYNFEYPELWLIDISGDTMTFTIMGPSGKWGIQKHSGFNSFNIEGGSFPDTLIAVRDVDVDLVELNLNYEGTDFIDQHGVSQSGRNHIFSFSRYDKAIEWEVNWHSFNEKNHPLSVYDQFKQLKTKPPQHSEKTFDLAYTWWRSPGGGVDPDHFATFAKAESDFTPGKYLIQITSDDGLRFFLDGKMIIDHWDIHVPATDSVTVDLNGKHSLEIEHFEGGGFSTLDFRIEPVR
jgi:parallel beta-helix repeat protein